MRGSRMKILTFARWNRAQSAKLAAGVDAARLRYIRRARRGAQARLMLWDDYLAACREAGARPEPF